MPNTLSSAIKVNGVDQKALVELLENVRDMVNAHEATVDALITGTNAIIAAAANSSALVDIAALTTVAVSSNTDLTLAKG